MRRAVAGCTLGAVLATSVLAHQTSSLWSGPVTGLALGALGPVGFDIGVERTDLLFEGERTALRAFHVTFGRSGGVPFLTGDDVTMDVAVDGPEGPRILALALNGGRIEADEIDVSGSRAPSAFLEALLSGLEALPAVERLSFEDVAVVFSIGGETVTARADGVVSRNDEGLVVEAALATPLGVIGLSLVRTPVPDAPVVIALSMPDLHAAIGGATLAGADLRLVLEATGDLSLTAALAGRTSAGPFDVALAARADAALETVFFDEIVLAQEGRSLAARADLDEPFALAAPDGSASLRLHEISVTHARGSTLVLEEARLGLRRGEGTLIVTAADVPAFGARVDGTFRLDESGFQADLAFDRLEAAGVASLVALSGRDLPPVRDIAVENARLSIASSPAGVSLEIGAVRGRLETPRGEIALFVDDVVASDFLAVSARSAGLRLPGGAALLLDAPRLEVEDEAAWRLSSDLSASAADLAALVHGVPGAPELQAVDLRPVRARLSVQGRSTIPERFDVALREPITLRAHEETIRVTSLSAHYTDGRISGDAGIESAAGPVRLNVDVHEGVGGRIGFEAEIDVAALPEVVARAIDDAEIEISGRARATGAVVFAQGADAALEADFDLGAARLVLHPIGRVKPAGSSANLETRLVFGSSGDLAIERFAFVSDTASVSGTGRIDVLGNARFDLPRTRIGARTNLSLSLVRPRAGTGSVEITGGTIDRDDFEKTRSQSALFRRASHMQFRFDEVRIADRTLSQVAGTLTSSGRGQAALDARGRIGAGGRLSLSGTIAPYDARLSLVGYDAGALATMLGLFADAGGGTLRADLSGNVLGGDFDVAFEGRDMVAREAPAFAHLVSVMSGVGIIEAIGSGGISFGQFGGALTVSEGVVQIRDTFAHSPSIGLTVEGRYDFSARRAHYTVSAYPAFLLNRTVGAIPVLGELFRRERQGGLFGFAFRVAAEGGETRVEFDPVSVITPGILGRINGPG